MSDPRRQLLLELYTRLVLLPAAEQPAAAALCAANSATSARWQGVLSEPPYESAVRIAHSLGMGPPGLQLWRASWGTDAQATAPLTRLATVAARLLAGREELRDCIQIVVNRGKAKGFSGKRRIGNSECRAKGPTVKLIGSDETPFVRELHQFVLRACHSLRISVQRNNKSVTSVWIGLFILRFNATRICEKDI